MSLPSSASTRPRQAPGGRTGGLVRRRLLALAGLAGATAAAGALTLWHSTRSASAEAERAASDRLFTWEEASRVEGLELTTAEGRVVIRHQPGEKVPWRIVEPRATAAESTAIDTLLRTVLAAKTTAVVPVGEDGGPPPAALFGLDSPRISLTLLGPDAQRERLDIGHKNTFDDSLFVRVRGREAVAICPANVEQAVDKTFFDLRDKRLLTMASQALREVVVEAEGTAGYTLSHHGDAWRLAAPVSAPADAGQADALVGAIVGLRAKAFITEGGEDPRAVRAHGLDRPLYRATLTDDTAAQAVLRVGRRRDGPSDVFFAQVEPAGAIVELNSDWVVKKLSTGTWELRDRHLAALAPREVPRLRLRAEGRMLTVAREGDDDAIWHGESEGAAEAPRRERLDRQKVVALVDRLRDLQASGVAAEGQDAPLRARLGLDPPALEIHIEGDAPLPGEEGQPGPTLATLHLGRPVAGERLVANLTGGPIWRISAGDVDGIGPAIESLLSEPEAAPEATAQVGEGK